MTTKMPMLREKAFENLSVNEKVGLLNNILLNIFRNYILNKIVKGSSGDLPWIKKPIKYKLKNRSKITKSYYKKGQVQLFLLNRGEHLECVNELY